MKRFLLFAVAAVALWGCATTPEGGDQGGTGSRGTQTGEEQRAESARLSIENLTDYPLVRGTVDQENEATVALEDELETGERERLDVVAGPADVELVFDVNGQEIAIRQRINIRPGDANSNLLSVSPDDLSAALAAATESRMAEVEEKLEGTFGWPMGPDAPDPDAMMSALDTAANQRQEPRALNRSDLPGHVRIFEAFERFGLEFTEIPDDLEDFLMELGLASSQDLELVALVQPEDGGPLEAMTLSEDPGEWNFDYTFPGDGNYRLSVAARPRGTDGEFVPVAAIDVASEFPPGHQAYTYLENDRWLRIVVRNVQNVNRPWAAADRAFDRYATGIVVGDYTIVNPVAELEVENGALVEFPQTADGIIDIIGVELDELLEVTTETQEFTFAAGSKVVFSADWVRGEIDHSFAQRVGGARVTFPPGAFVEVSDGILTAVSSPERVLLRHGTHMIPFTDAEFDELDADRVLRGQFVVSEARTIRVVDTRIDLPEGAVILTDGAGITQIYADEQFPIYRAGSAITVEPGEAAFFFPNGAFDGVRER
ncbi:MAG: hypothetical protein ACLFP4_10265 [Spirochaetales bacterium]